jgi:hypothetical protein
MTFDELRLALCRFQKLIRPNINETARKPYSEQEFIDVAAAPIAESPVCAVKSLSSWPNNCWPKSAYLL